MTSFSSEKSEGEPDEIQFAQVAALTDAIGTAAAEYLASRAGGVFLPVLEKGDCEDLELIKIADQTREHGNAIAVLLGAIHDGTVTSAERQEALPHIDAALRGLARLRACLLAASEEA